MRKITEIDWKSLSYEERDKLIAGRLAVYESQIANKNGGKRPKKEGFIMERIASIENLRQADIDAQRGKKKRTICIKGKMVRVPDRHIQRHNANAEEELRQLQLMILTLEFPPQDYRVDLMKTDAGKTREIIKQHYFPWRILHHAILRVTMPYIDKSFITDTFACIKGRGLHYGVKRITRFLRRNKSAGWFWKTDFKKYYQSIPHELIYNSFSRLFKDKVFLKLIELVVLQYSNPEIDTVLDEEKEKRARNPYWIRSQSNNR